MEDFEGDFVAMFEEQSKLTIPTMDTMDTMDTTATFTSTLTAMSCVTSTMTTMVGWRIGLLVCLGSWYFVGFSGGLK